LRLETVRLWGHAGSDIETAYRTPAQIEASEARDPLVRNARRLLETGAATPEQLRELVARVRERGRRAREEAAVRGHLDTAEAVVAPLAPWDAEAVRDSATERVPEAQRRAFWGPDLPEAATSPVKR